MKLEVIDMPLNDKPYQIPQKVLDAQHQQDLNKHELNLIKAFANTSKDEVFTQNTVRAFIDFVWPIAQQKIIRCVFLPYLAFTMYFMLYLVVIKRLEAIKLEDKQFYEFTAGMFAVYDIMFKSVLFLGCFYFIFQDLRQMNSLASNPIVLWSYINIVPLGMMMFVVVWDMFFNEGNAESGELQKTLYSTTAFLVWTRVIHLMKCFTHTAHLMRMATEILYRIRWLIAFIIISLISFGFTFFYVSGSKMTSPFEGIQEMFQVLLGQYDITAFTNNYQMVLLVIVSCVNAFFIFTLLVSLSVISFAKGDRGVWSNESYQDKASLIGLYSYLLTEQAIRVPAKQYLLLATVSDCRKRGSHGGEPGQTQMAGAASDPKTVQKKTMKNIERRLTSLQSKLDRSLKEI